ncbi:hypothetical protein [Streptomyces sp. DW26H14]|uniref:hypothetical protein n=1 Tax=Streptomyces sp. DW26H14 TaxID=3435395 RepID=UPI00403DB677
MAIVGPEQAKTQLGIALDNDAYDAELQTYLGAASIAVEKACGEAVDPHTVVDTLVLPGGSRSFLLTTTPVIAVTALSAVDGGKSWSVDDLSIDGPSGLVTVVSGPAVSGTVRAAYTAGMDPIPDNYTLATLIILQHLWETRRGSMGVQMGGTDDYMPGPGWAIPRRALELLGLSMPGVA